MSKPLILEVHDEPSYFNKEAVIGFFLVPPIGAVVGAFIGKDRMENERINGKVIKEPTSWNKDALLGGLIGSAVSSAVGYVGVTLAVLAEVNPVIAAIGFIATATLGIIGGAMIGADIGKETMQQEAVQARQQQLERERGQSPARAQEHERDTGINYSQDHARDVAEARARKGEIALA